MQVPYSQSEYAPKVDPFDEKKAHSLVDNSKDLYPEIYAAIAYAFDLDLDFIIECSNYDLFRIEKSSKITFVNWMQFVTQYTNVINVVVDFLCDIEDEYEDQYWEKSDFLDELTSKQKVRLGEKYQTANNYITQIKERSFGMDLSYHKKTLVNRVFGA